MDNPNERFMDAFNPNERFMETFNQKGQTVGQQVNIAQASVSPYQMTVNNVARYIKEHPAGTNGSIDAFAASTVLAIAFCTDKEKVINDIVAAFGSL